MAPDLDSLPVSTQNYLKAVWVLREWDDAPVTKTALAARVGVTLSSASDAVRKLSQQGLLDNTHYGAVELTDHGRDLAVAMVRRHRLIETYLVAELGYTWDEVHAEAEKLEHAASNALVDAMARKLNYPMRDPHGDPIPTRDGRIETLDAIAVSALPRETLDAGCEARVERISDADPELLRYLAQHGVITGARIRLARGPAFTDTVSAKAYTVAHADTGNNALTLGPSAAAAIWVSLMSTPA
ncbi:metal-dependent transcriptional regulator [Corynebacterium uterequi]|uniref:Diphtheria toxin repressor n=1 Tax=Corynebacterium uterequi TaxID=1072256 RepID=A0A0G3HJ48_9CORY|nr:metal-dependent transcriptional regulator [Corynebacterium uterequi]AKK11127.1 iron (metal) dependent repressor, DtxR family [Corynebacterium uterequi]